MEGTPDQYVLSLKINIEKETKVKVEIIAMKMLQKHMRTSIQIKMLV